MRYRKRVMFLLSAIFIAACAGYGTLGGGDDEPDDDAGNDGGENLPSCENDNQCPQGQVCENHLCQDPPGGGDDGGPGTPDGGTGGSSDGGNDSGTGGGNDGGSGTPDGGTGGGDGGGTGGCERDRDCPEKQVCEDGRCEPKCHGDHDGDDDDNDDKVDPGGSCAEGPTSCKAGKSLICHVPPGNPSNRHSICVGNSAVPAHLGHGDNPGCCPR